MSQAIGHKIIRYDSVASTNSTLKELAQEGVESGTVIVSTIQTEGRGRLERKWESPEGGLWLSVLLGTPGQIATDKSGLIPLMTGCAVAVAIRCKTGLRARVKWPNDVLVNEKKVCGILGEMVDIESERLAVIGIGINVYNPVQSGYEFSKGSTSLVEELGSETDLRELETAILAELEQRNQTLMDGRYEDVLGEWREMSVTLGRQVRVITPTGELDGLARDIDEDGSLLLEMADGSVKKIIAGDCRHLD